MMSIYWHRCLPKVFRLLAGSGFEQLAKLPELILLNCERCHQPLETVESTGPENLRIDEVSPLGKTMVTAVENGSLHDFEIHPQDVGLGRIEAESLLGGDATENAKILLSILDGSDRGPRRQAVQINAAAALVVAGLAPDLQSAWNLAEASLDEGRAMASLQSLQKVSAL